MYSMVLDNDRHVKHNVMLVVTDDNSPFRLIQPWQKSTFTVETHESTTPLLALMKLDPVDTFSNTIITPLDLELEDADSTNRLSSIGDPQDSASSEDHSEPREHDFWDQDFDRIQACTDPSALSWETFQGYEQTPKLYISEEDQPVFDALADRLQPSIGVLPLDKALRSLCNLALGRSSLFYQWNNDKNVFEAILESAAISGYTLATSNSVVADTLRQGTLLRRLQDHVHTIRQNITPSAVRVAFRRSVARILNVVETWIATTVSSIQSLLQLTQMVDIASRMLQTCWRLCREVETSASDATTLSSISSALQTMDGSSDNQTQVVASLLRQVTQPWRAQLLHDIGFGTDPGSLSSYTLQADSAVDGFAASGSVLTDNDKVLLDSIVKERELLRLHDPDHPLVDMTSFMTIQQDFMHLDVIDDIIARASQLESELEAAIQKHNSEVPGQLLSSHEIHSNPSDTDAWKAFELDFDFHTAHTSCLVEAALESAARSAEDALERCTMNVLTNANPQFSLEDIPTAVLQPAASIRPFLNTQSRLTHRAVMALLFQTHHLGQVFDLHHQTFLFGNADFVDRLSSAFFDSNDTQAIFLPTKRKNGLGLNALTSVAWPPSSSDLSLNLMGVLDQLDNHGTQAASFDGTARLSFAVRELSEAEIEKVCEPASIHALDFVRLQCNITSPLNTIFTSATIKWYDEVFSTLLLHTRMLHLVTMMRTRLLQSKRSLRGIGNTKAQAHYINRAHHLVKTLAHHAVQVAVAGPWQEMRAAIEKCERIRLERNATNDFGLDVLHEMHIKCLGRIRSYLFIGRRYEEVRKALHDGYTSILSKGSMVLDGDPKHDWSDISQPLSEATQRLVFHLEHAKHRLQSQGDGESEAECESTNLLLKLLA